MDKTSLWREHFLSFEKVLIPAQFHKESRKQQQLIQVKVGFILEVSRIKGEKVRYFICFSEKTFSYRFTLQPPYL